MHSTYLSLSLLLGFLASTPALASVTPDRVLYARQASATSLPACVQNCAAQALTASGCAPTNMACWCNSPAFNSTSVNCIMQGCPQELANATALADGECAPYFSSSMSSAVAAAATSKSSPTAAVSVHTSSGASLPVWGAAVVAGLVGLGVVGGVAVL